jgi:hypothetical protein
MTFSARFKVKTISEGPAPIEIIAVAGLDEITANTEGNVTSMALRINLFENETAIRTGDIITVTGHFTN